MAEVSVGVKLQADTSYLRRELEKVEKAIKRFNALNLSITPKVVGTTKARKKKRKGP